jgi:hypothetical protein
VESRKIEVRGQPRQKVIETDMVVHACLPSYIGGIGKKVGKKVRPCPRNNLKAKKAGVMI